MPIGVHGTMNHVLTNKKVKDKKGCINSLLRNGTKDTLIIAGAAGAAGGAAAIAAKKSPKFVEFLKKEKNNFADTCKHTMTNLKTKFSSLPTPAKAAVGVGGAFLATFGTVAALNSYAKAGRIEAEYEE